MNKGLFCLAYLVILTASISWSQPTSQDEEAVESTEVSVDVLFKLWNNDLSQEYEEALKPHAEILIENPDINAVIEGYSDSSGDPDSNVELSRIRAEAVKFYLVGLGVAPENLIVEPKGGTDLFAEGDSFEALSANRRARLVYNLPVTPEEETVVTDETSLAQEDTSEGTGEAEITIAEIPPPTPGPTPPPTPMPTPHPTPPSSLIKEIGREINKTASGNVVFVTPGKMQLQVTYLVQATVKNDFSEDLSVSAAKASDLEGLLLSGDMLILLTGDGFDIRPMEDSYNSKDLFPEDHGAQLDSVSTEGDIVWKWYVTPVKSGFQPLTLSLIIDIEEPKYSPVNTEYEIYKRIVDVREGLLRSIVSSYWVNAFVIIIAIAVLSYIILGRYNSI